MKHRTLLGYIFLLWMSGTLSAQQAKVELGIADGNLSCSVSYKGQKLMSGARLGIHVDHERLGKGAEIVSVQEHASGRTYLVKNSFGRNLNVDVREFDDGIALRYRFPSDAPCCIYGEETTFAFPSGTRVWYASGPFQYGWIQAYRDCPTDSVEGELLAPPATFLMPGAYMPQ